MWQVYSTRSHKTRQSSLWSSQPPRNSSRHRQPLWAKWRMQRANLLSTPTQSVSFCQANPNLNLVGVTNWQFKFAIHFSANIDWKLGVLNVLTLADVTPRRKYESHMFFFWTDALELRLEAGLVFGGVGVAANCDGDFDRSRLPPPSVDQTANCRIDERNTAWRPERVRPRSVSSSGVLVPKVLNFDQFEISSTQASSFSRLKRAFFLNAMEIVLP